MENRLSLSAKEENANSFDVILKGRKGRGIFLGHALFTMFWQRI